MRSIHHLFATRMVFAAASCAEGQGFSSQPENSAGLRLMLDYQSVWFLGADAPPLLTSSPSGTSRADAGVLGLPGTSVVFGGDDIGNRVRQGLVGEIYYDFAMEWCIFGRLSFAGNDPSASATVTSDGTQILSRPFLDAQSGLQDAELVAFPNVLQGTASVRQTNELLWTDLGAYRRILQGSVGHLYLAAGYRFLDLDDTFLVQENLTSIDLGGVVPLQTEFVVRDRFSTRNQFNGVIIGTGISSRFRKWSIDLRANLGLGALNRKLSIEGETEVTIPGLATSTTPGGLLAQSTNIGTYKSTEVVFMPEIGCKLHWNISSSLSAGVGYSLMLVPDVWFAVEQADTSVNASLIGGGPLLGPARPVAILRQSDLVIQSLTYGVSFSF